MEIRATKKDFKKFKKLNKNDVQITLDETLETSVIMIHITEGDSKTEASLKEWTRGFDNISSFLKYGYVRVIKNCPYRIGKCIGEKCSLYVVKPQYSSGDCSHVWSSLS